MTGSGTTTTVVTPVTVITETVVTVPNPDAALYSFSTFTFDNAGATGRFGPNLTACRTRYATTAPTATWTQNSSYLNMTTNGIQEWTVPASGSYTIRAKGAAGGNPTSSYSKGIDIQTTTTLSKGEVIQILVGQMGSSNGLGSLEPAYTSGGGGGTFVIRGTQASPIAIIVAGGGGGRGKNGDYVSSNASSDTSGNKAGDGGGNNAVSSVTLHFLPVGRV